ncbi:uncharacterized protein FOMMEDRAFT_154844 [Fomitiporia mediterranea MF3/22]|uniref:uncharacterized protein n=1 Tax=Fomitiporia mediterranea (strain MF3/22) TaxID=694068 RepID=UPI0004408921|nr:uncharacterized protein FOMMEDRAFT_154844 [Fomitiporia mediterranea MF3/22]EJD03739.1 hypothetical protein FOMMEDRAFT_154844 [Fomitiporia mediterranea MF3/22]
MAGLVRYNFTIDDTSPILFYSPYADVASASGQGDGLHNGWQTWYSGSGFLPNRDAPSPVGESFHLTSAPGASVSLSFYGTGVALYGTTNSSYDVFFDGSFIQNATSFQNVLFSVSDKAPGFYNVSLTAKPDSGDQILSFNNAIVNSAANSSASSTPVYETIDNQNTSAIAYAGDWTPSKTVADIPSSASPAPFHSTTASGASASFNFTGRAVALYGSSTTNHGLYSVNLDGTKHLFNGSSQWLLGNMLLFYQDGLEENTTHSLSITNVGTNALSLNSVQITHFNNTLTSTNRAASKAGIIVGPIIAFLVVASMIGFYIWSKRRAKRRSNGLERRSSVASSIFLPRRFRREHNEQEGDAVTPYVIDMRAPKRDIGPSSDSSSLDLRLTGHLRGMDRVRDEKGLPLPVTSSVPESIRGTEFTASADHRSALSVPVTYLPSELGASRNEGAEPQNNSRLSRGPLPAPENASYMISDDPALVDRILELVAQRIDTQRAEPGGLAPGSGNLPPYPEDL